MKIAYLSEHRWAHGTETHIAATLESMGHQVERIAELSEIGKDPQLMWKHVRGFGADLVLYTRSHGFPPHQRERAVRMMRAFADVGITTVSYHLDLYLGLQRHDTLANDPFWATAWVFTPDGDPDSAHEFEARGIRHVWSPPAVYKPECFNGEHQDRFAHDVVFVGSYPYPHPEWPYRNELVEWLRATYGDRFAHYGGNRTVRNGLQAVNGWGPNQLNDLYASAKVVVGDSLCPGFTKPFYWSDRLTETLGRGGVLVWPAIQGVTEQGFKPGVHFAEYAYGDFYDLRDQIDGLIAMPDVGREMARNGQEFVREHHTYDNRMATMLETVTS